MLKASGCVRPVTCIQPPLCHHADDFIALMRLSPSSLPPPPKVTPIVSTNCISAGEALRLIDHKDIIKSDFILVSGDTVSNMALGPVLEAHRARREKDKNAIMTMVRADWGRCFCVLRGYLYIFIHDHGAPVAEGTLHKRCVMQ